MNRLSLSNRAKILHCLVEGSSMRATTRLCDVSINTVIKLLVDVGFACSIYQNEVLRNLPCKRVQCDEIWSFCGSKQKNVPEGNVDAYGDVYAWTAVCADTKLCASFLVGRRDVDHGHAFISDLASRMANRSQLSTDGLKIYVDAVEAIFGSDFDNGMLIKHYTNPDDLKGAMRRYSPSDFVKTEKMRITGNPDVKALSISCVKSQNLTMRMSTGRFTRLTNGLCKKMYNLECAIALHLMYYNFGRIHKAMRVTPAMEAGVMDHVWTLEEIAALAT